MDVTAAWEEAAAAGRKLPMLESSAEYQNITTIGVNTLPHSFVTAVDATEVVVTPHQNVNEVSQDCTTQKIVSKTSTTPLRTANKPALGGVAPAAP